MCIPMSKWLKFFLVKCLNSVARDPSSNPRAGTIFFNFLYITAGFKKTDSDNRDHCRFPLITAGFLKPTVMFMYIKKNSFIY